MKQILHILTLVSIIFICAGCGDKLYRDTYRELDEILSQRELYFQRQQEMIQSEEQRLLTNVDLVERFDICYNLFNLSRSYKYDIAHKYSKEALNIAKEIGDPNLICRAEASQISAFTSGGLFTEAARVVRTANIEGVDGEVRRELYYNTVRYFSDQIDYINNVNYRTTQINKLRSYADSVISLSPIKDYYYYYAKCTKEQSEDNYEQIIEDLSVYLESAEITTHHNAILSFALGYAYFKVGDIANGFRSMTRSVRCDVEAAVRENKSIKSISEQFFAVGQTSSADRLIDIAYEDAKFYNARHRNLEVNALLPIINEHKIATISRQRNILYSLLFLISILSVLAIVFVVIARRNAKVAKASKRTIQEQLNRLSEIHNQLLESNKIKEYYIISSLCKSNEQLKQSEALLKKIDVKVKNRLYDDLHHIYKDFNLKREKENFFVDFDRAFLNLFTNFIEEYNTLFREEDRIDVESSSELPPEVRIFALMRLGITDTERISRFLDLSVNTIYTYKTKIKSRSIVPKEEFESRILNIKLS